MDILNKLRVIFWFLVVGLWGLYLYQYINKDLNSLPKIRLNTNPFGTSAPSKPEKRIYYPPAEGHRGADVTQGISVSSSSAARIPPASEKISTEVLSTDRMLVNAKEIKDIPSLRGTLSVSVGNPQDSVKVGKEEDNYPPAPKGFATKITKHFVIYQEGEEVSKELIDSVESLHGEIMLDLIAFSPWQRDKKVYVFFSKSSQTYQRITGRPAWSGGAANSAERKIYLYESEEAMGILAHELTHIYFDGFFGEQFADPLWLSEGMAVFIQVERANSYPRWLKENMDILKNGGGFKLEDLVRIENLEDADDKSVKLWYAQSYSLVYFLMHVKQGDAFYQFCKRIKNREYVSKALYASYGSPYNKLSSLEVVWRYDLKTGKLSQINR